MLPVYQPEISWLNWEAILNMDAVLVALSSCHVVTSPLNEVAPKNVAKRFCTLETSQPLMSALTLVHPANIRLMSFTWLRSGTSSALSCRFSHPQKADCMDCHWISPQALISTNFSLSPALLNRICGKAPVILIQYIPCAGKVMVTDPVCPVNVPLLEGSLKFSQ